MIRLTWPPIFSTELQSNKLGCDGLEPNSNVVAEIAKSELFGPTVHFATTALFRDIEPAPHRRHTCRKQSKSLGPTAEAVCGQSRSGTYHLPDQKIEQYFRV